MNIDFGPKRLLTSLNTDVTDGSFALDHIPLGFETCRERFAAAFKQDTKGFYFKHPAGQSVSVAAFILKTEAILKEPEQSVFAETNRNTILWVQPSEFWKCCPVRRSLLTVLLRAGILYDSERDNYEDALFKQEYVVPTKKAVMRFLFGFTDYRGPEILDTGTIWVRGWKTIFEGKTEAEVRAWLVAPPQMSYTPTVELESALWA